MQQHAQALAATSLRLAEATGVGLTPLQKSVSESGIDYRYVSIAVNCAARNATLSARAPDTPQPSDIAGIEAAVVHWWPLQMARELDDAILHLRTNELELRTWILKTRGDASAVLAVDATVGQVKMPDYRWGIFLAQKDEGRKVTSARTRAWTRGRKCRASTAPTCAA